MALHDDELAIDEDLGRDLVADQLPQHAGQPVRRLTASGSTNALFRLGDELLVRLPRQRGGSAGILHEARWTPYVAAALPVAVPVVAVGEPDDRYPEHWSVVRWVEGEHPPATATGGADLADDLAAVLQALAGLPVPAEAQDDPGLSWYRGGPLAAVDEEVRDYADQCRHVEGLDLDVAAALAVWEQAVAEERAEPAAAQPGWLHGDLLAENLLVRDGRLSAVLDLGCLAVGRPEVDLVAAWEVLTPTARGALRATAGVGDAAWRRGQAWAVAIALMTFPYYWTSMPQRCASRLVIARQVLAEVG